MCRCVMHVFCAIALSFFYSSGVAQASSLGKVDVASHLGEPFYAEIPLGLEEGELISDIFIELASAADYRILEVFHDSTINSLRVDVKNDSRGSRVELTSTSIIEAPFLNLVLKVRHGRATHFKKFSIFLDLPRAATVKTNSKTILPVRRFEDPVVKPDPILKPVMAIAQKKSPPESDNHWARTNRYGPMVFGDTISTVAQRLRTDDRYTQQQVMVALFEKNKDKFSKGNINIITAGTYLDVPSAIEVEHITHAQASNLLREHNAKWKELTKQRKYAKVQTAQKNRYSKHVSIGEAAEGVASQSIGKKEKTSNVLPQAAKETQAAASAPKTNANAPINAQNNDKSAALLLENNILQLRLKEMEAKVSKLETLPAPDQNLAASNARIKKLEIQLARQNGALEKARKQQAMQPEVSSEISLLTWILMGFVALLSILAGYLVYALRGQRRHPVEQVEEALMVEPELEEINIDGIEEIEEIDIEEVGLKDSLADTSSQTKEPTTKKADQTENTQDPLAIRIPELTDEDTSEMEAFSETDEDPDPNVDYLTEADVYMRYGMEDEAEKQVCMALRLRNDNKEAHIKLAEIRHERGDTTGVAEAGRVANGALTGAALTAFMTVFDALADGNSLPEDLDSIASTNTADESPAPDASGEALLTGDESFEVADFELPDFSVSDISDDALADAPVSEKVQQKTAATANTQASDGDHGNMLDFDLDGIDLSSLDVDNNELPSDEGSAKSDDTLDGIDLDDLDLSALDASDGEVVSIESSPESNDVLGGINLDDIDLSALDASDGEVVSIESSSEPDDALGGIDLDDIDLSGLDVGDDEVVSIESSSESDDALDGIDFDDFDLSGLDVGDDEIVSIESSSEASDTLDFNLSNLDMPSDEALEEVNSPIISGLESTQPDQASDTIGLSAEMQTLDAATEDFDLSALQTNFDSSTLTQKMSAVDAVALNVNTDQKEDELLSMALDLDDLGIDFNNLEEPSEDDPQATLDNTDDSFADPFNALGDADAGLNDAFDVDMPSLEDPSPLSDSEEEVSLISDDLTTMAFNLDDLDIDLEVIDDAAADAEMEEFTSTIQATLLELGVDDSDLDISMEPIIDSTPNTESLPKTEDEFDFSEDLELNNLLIELDSFSGKT
ncbi:MAG: FimV/HubP family polar landmark protein [Mariprofundaceae bacterium]|nr:FimV/HubP family polar landmark protein [Mariprofundaceae bacterium]